MARISPELRALYDAYLAAQRGGIPAQSARSYDGLGSPTKPSAARRSRPRRSSTGYSITWSARSSSVCGMVSPSAFAVLRIDDQFGLHRLLPRQLRWSFALEEPTRIVALEGYASARLFP